MTDAIARVLEVKGTRVETTTPQTTVAAAVALMNELRIGALVVIANGRPVGIFTERDVLVRVVATGRIPGVTRVADVMTPDPVTIGADTTVGEAMRTITRSRCRHLPVVDAGGLRGLISIGDLTSWIVEEQQRTIHDLHHYIRAA
jgi:CBS domain-containing protein